MTKTIKKMAAISKSQIAWTSTFYETSLHAKNQTPINRIASTNLLLMCQNLNKKAKEKTKQEKGKN